MQIISLAATCLFLALPMVTQAEYIHITLPEETEYRPCGPGEVRWESDIDPGEGNVLKVRWRNYGMCPNGWHSLGLSSNDGVQPWPDPPCHDPGYPYFCAHTVRIDYISDPSVCDSVRFWCGPSSVDGPTIFIDFSGTAVGYDQVESRVDPTPYATVSAYVGMAGVAGGLTVVSFALEVGPLSVLVPVEFESLLPGNLFVGSWDSGITVASTECVGVSGQLVYLGRLDMFYLGGQGDVIIIDHPDWPRQAVNCDEPGEFFEFVVGNHGGVGKDPVSTPVKAATWGSIKAMFRP